MQLVPIGEAWSVPPRCIRFSKNRQGRSIPLRLSTSCAAGEAEIGFQQVAELRPVRGVDQFGELPRDLQKQIPYSAGISAKAKDAATARALVTFLRSPAAQDVLKRKGMDLP